ncbi:MAG: hypothetical protein RR678_04005 [Lachnospiraceae bacterium]
MRLKYSLLAKFNILTNKELDFILYIARYQNDVGCVEGVYYRDVCQNTTMCKQTFYKVLESLTAKGLISYQKGSHMDYNIRILQNDCSGEHWKEGYINLNRKVFRDMRFKKMKVAEKYLVLDFLKNTFSQHGSCKIGVERFYEKYQSLLHVTKRVLRYYLHTVRRFFAIGIKNRTYFITYLHQEFGKEKQVPATKIYREYRTKVIMRQLHIPLVQQKEFTDTSDLCKQYGLEATRQGKDIYMILADSIAASIFEKKEKCLHAKNIHRIMRIYLNLSNA